MIMLTTYDIYEYLLSKLQTTFASEDLASIIKNGAIDKRAQKSIGVFNAPETRSASQVCIGGIDATAVKVLPINILVRWGSNARDFDTACNAIYKELFTESPNFQSNNVKIAYIHLLDSCPINIGRDEFNVCEASIRANIYYYI